MKTVNIDVKFIRDNIDNEILMLGNFHNLMDIVYKIASQKYKSLIDTGEIVINPNFKHELAATRLQLLQERYDTIDKLLYELMGNVSGFQVTEMQVDIANFIADMSEPRIMVQAQRGQAKSTIAIIYAIYHVIHNPEHNILFVTSTSQLGKDTIKQTFDYINACPYLNILKPDKKEGDGTSKERFNINGLYRKPDKNNTFSSSGIDSQITGRRANVIISDDIETKQIGTSANKMQTVISNTSEFDKIVIKGRIIYLGTPHSSHSLYNDLPHKGFLVRVYPGRYPTEEQRTFYGERLAPLLVNKMRRNPDLCKGGGILGDQGQPTDTRLDELSLQEKELTGMADFQLQYMLNVSLTDKERSALSLEDLIIYNEDDNLARVNIMRPRTEHNIFKFPDSRNYTLYSGIADTSSKVDDMKHVVMSLDPAGKSKYSKDEMAYCISTFGGGRVHIKEISGLQGGMTDENTKLILSKIKEFGVAILEVEVNGMGIIVKQVLESACKNAGLHVSVQEKIAAGRKELRILGALEPVMKAGKLIMTPHAVQFDRQSIRHYDAKVRETYSVLYQISMITEERNTMPHDDRVDVLSQAVQYWVDLLSIGDQFMGTYTKTTKTPEHFNNERIYFDDFKKESVGTYIDLGSSIS